MPAQSQYQSVFRVVKPNGTKRSESNGKTTKPAKDVSTNGHSGHDAGNGISQAQLRLQHLETLVTSLMQTTQAKAAASKETSTVVAYISPEAASETSSAVNSGALSSAEGIAATPSLATVSVGHLDNTGTETKYRGSTHWLAILENVSITVNLFVTVSLTLV
jgi:hypothetical protein